MTSWLDELFMTNDPPCSERNWTMRLNLQKLKQHSRTHSLMRGLNAENMSTTQFVSMKTKALWSSKITLGLNCRKVDWDYFWERFQQRFGWSCYQEMVLGVEFISSEIFLVNKYSEPVKILVNAFDYCNSLKYLKMSENLQKSATFRSRFPISIEKCSHYFVYWSVST